MPASSAADTAIDPLESCTPLPDALGPMFAKELRQGLRARRFVLPFVAIQIFALVAIGTELGLTATFDSTSGTSIFGNLVTIVIVIGVGVVMPLTNIAALRPELNDGRNVELLLMSNLDRWQIVRGKWLVGFTLSVLVLVSMVPYLLTRYFLGGDLVQTMLLLIGLLFGNATFTALAVGASGFGNLLGRFLLLGIGVLSFSGTIYAAGWRFFEKTGNATGSDAIWPGIISILVSGLVSFLYVAYGLQLGRARLRLFENPLDPPASGLIIALTIFTPIVVSVATAATLGYAAWVAVGGLLALVLYIDRAPRKSASPTAPIAQYAQP